jgi:aspartate-semialdehyde dehydrogenase
MRTAVSEDRVRAILSKAPSVKIVDDRIRNYFPMPIDASGQDDVLVGRIRSDLAIPRAIRFLCSWRRTNF